MKKVGIRIGAALVTISLVGCGEGTPSSGPAGAAPAPPPPPDLKKAFEKPGPGGKKAAAPAPPSAPAKAETKTP